MSRVLGGPHNSFLQEAPHNVLDYHSNWYNKWRQVTCCKTTDYWSPQDERCLIWNDADVAITWPIKEKPVLSRKDNTGI